MTGWPEEEAYEAAATCFRAWLDGFGGIENKEERAVLSQVRDFFTLHGNSRFQSVAKPDAFVNNRVGFWRTVRGQDEDEREYLVPAGAFISEICAGLDPQAAAEILHHHGWIVGLGDRFPQRLRLPGLGQARTYVFPERMLQN